MKNPKIAKAYAELKELDKTLTANEQGLIKKLQSTNDIGEAKYNIERWFDISKDFITITHSRLIDLYED